MANAWLRERGLWWPVAMLLIAWVVVWGLHEDHPNWFQGPVGRALFAPAAAHKPGKLRPRFALPGQARLGGSPGGGAPPSRSARAEIPPRYLELYRQAGRRYHLPWQVLAGIGAQESGHGQSTLPGVHSGSNYAGACGPMQIGCVPGSAAGNSWARYGQGGDVHDPADAIPGAASYLVGHGAHADLRGAVYAYNGDPAYVARVFATARRYGYAP